MISRRNALQKRYPKKKSRPSRNDIHQTSDGPISNELVKDVKFPLNGTLGNNVVNVIAAFESPSVHTSSASVPTFVSYATTLNSFDKVSSYTGCFDQYRIRMIEMVLIPHASDNTTFSASSGLFTTVIDYDDATNLTTVADALSYSTSLTTSGTTIQKRCFIPHIADAVYSGAFTSFGNETCPWIDAASTTVQHYGLKSAWTTSSAVCAYDLVVRAWIQFRNSR